MFSDVAEEKKARSANTVPEAKSNKSTDTFIYLGKFISEKLMETAINMVKEVFKKKLVLNIKIILI